MVQLNATPLSVADVFQKQSEGPARSWIFTSATLSAGDKFNHFTEQLGLVEARCESWQSPFDYPKQALLYVPQDLPLPNSDAHVSALLEEAVALLKLSSGRAFLLCTSLRVMRQVAQRLPEQLSQSGLDYPVLVQGDLPKNELLSRFRAIGNAVLIGSQSFWEGVDVPGDALSLVMIDKLPFAPPDDPVLSARMRHLEANGGNPFREWQLPSAAITLKQGAGRLIRRETDRGVLAVFDVRLADKPYGRWLLKSLPAMTRTRQRADVAQFFTCLLASE
jgi:ATP-dependent DNA helicase DinG